MRFVNTYTMVTVTADLSPKTMAAQAFSAAVAEIKEGATREQSVALASDPALEVEGEDATLVVDDSRVENEADVGARIEQLWKAGGDPEANFKETLTMLLAEVESLTNAGLSAFRDLDATSRQLAQSKELAETRAREAQRLHAIDEQSRASLSNLLRAVEASKADARDGSRAAQIESRLRSEVQQLRDERDKAQSELCDHRRKRSLLEEELRLTKSKLGRVMQEKVSMERDSRAAISLARSLDNNNSNDMHYYKRKVGELTEKVQSQKEKIEKQATVIAELGGGQGNKRKSY